MKSALYQECREEKRQKHRIQAWKGQEAAKKYELKSCFKLKEIFQRDQNTNQAVVSQ